MAIFSLKNCTVSLLFILAFVLTSWSILISKQTHPLSVVPSNEPDAYMENIVAIMMDKKGLPSLKIEAPKMLHYIEKDTTHIITPHVTIFRDSPEPWYINSDTADATNGTEQIVFSNHVIIHHPADVANPNTTMNTTSLTVFPDQQQAKTVDPVVITQPDTIIHAIGMLANLNSGTIKLLSNAKGDYVPNS